jgi:hypothetical protein
MSYAMIRTLQILALVTLCVPPFFPKPYQPILYGLSLFLSFCAGWPEAQTFPRLPFLRNKEGRIPALAYFQFAGALSLLVAMLIGVVML